MAASRRVPVFAATAFSVTADFSGPIVVAGSNGLDASQCGAWEPIDNRATFRRAFGGHPRDCVTGRDIARYAARALRRD